MQCMSNDYNSKSREPLQHIKAQVPNNLKDVYNVPFSHFNNISNENMDPSQTTNEIKSVINNKKNDNAQLLQENKINNLYVRRQHNKSNNSISKINTNQLQIDIDIVPTINSANSINSFITNNNLSSASSISSISSSISYSSNNNNNNNNSNNKKKKKKTESLFKKLTNLVTNNIKQEEEEEETQQEEAQEEEEEEEIFTPLTGNTPRINRSITPIFGCGGNGNEDDYINEIIGKDTFITDYIDELFEEEKKQLQQLQQIKIKTKIKISEKQRQNVIDWICGIGLNFELQRSTIYKTIYYFDKLLLGKQINESHIQMVAASCLLIAIKWNEKEEKVPSLYKLSRICNKKYAPSSFKPMEIKILTALNFKLKIITPLDFVLYYISSESSGNGCIFNDDSLDGHCNLHLHNQSNIYLKKFAIFFLDISCQKYSFYNYLPSILAFSVIIASRRALKIEPYFSKKLIKLCHYQPSHIQDLINCFNELWLEYNTKFPSDAAKAHRLQPIHLHEYLSNINIINTNLNRLMEIDSN